ncbi:MAG: Nramp family divalent metal transporter [Bdellovibrionales bacterium]|nr:Nramp family divalent metal transporter [Bdellovibrionales bacterium]
MTDPRLPSLAEAHASVKVPMQGSFWRKWLAFSGPGLLVAVGYMDPGNWATDLAGGARFGYLLLSVIFISNLLAILLQHLALKLGVATGLDLAQACREYYSRRATIALWLLCELAIVACDMAEVIGSAIALKLLFGWPLLAGVLVTALDVFILLLLPQRNFRIVELFVAILILVIGLCFGYELFVASPQWNDVLRGLFPSMEIIRNPEMLYIAAGILGATVMPHNLYLHSSIVQTRDFPRTREGRSMAIRFGTLDSTFSLGAAFFVNAAILILSAAAFHGTPHESVADLSDAHRLLSPVLGAPLASLLFAIALLASGQNSTLTGTLAGQIVMEGFLNLRIRPWLRRLITRSLALIPAAIVAAYWGEGRVGDLLLWSQVVLSIQLSFAVVPLVIFTSSDKIMGTFRNAAWLKWAAWCSAFFIIVLNAALIVSWLRA